MAEVHLFILWSAARPWETAIVGDIAARFRLLDLVEVTWSAARFGQNLRCFYGTALPPDSQKEQHAGTGPFVVAVVEDERPRQRLRRMGSGRRWVNTRVIDARTEYRAATGGGYRVHASESAREADRDLVLLFGRRARAFRRGKDVVAPTMRQHAADLIGAAGWHDEDELLLALRVTAGVRRLPAGAGGELRLEVADDWWAREVLGHPESEGDVEVLVGGRRRRVRLVERRRRSWDPICAAADRWLPPGLANGREVSA